MIYQQLYLAMVIAAYAGFIVTLLGVSIWQNLPDDPKAKKA